MRDAMQYYEMTTIDADMEEYVLGTDEITYTDSAYSAPMMTSVAYQCVVLRVPDGTDVPKAKQTLLDNANPAKWICVEAESVAVESIGDVILYVMGFDEDVSAIKRCISCIGRMRWMQLRNNKLFDVRNIRID